MSISIENAHFSYGRESILKDISFKAKSGEMIAVLGPNGAGKSTLFRLILGLLPASGGRVLLDDVDVRSLAPRQLAKKIAYVPQSHYPTFTYTVLEMVLMGLSAHMAAFASPGTKEVEEARCALERMGMLAFADKPFTRISGGEQQLVLIARALAQKSRIIIMDEPTANLDFGNQLLVLSRMRSLAAEGYLVLFSTHNPEQAYQFSHRIIAMKEGMIIADASPKEVIVKENIMALYKTDVIVESLLEDAYRVCLGKNM